MAADTRAQRPTSYCNGANRRGITTCNNNNKKCRYSVCIEIARVCVCIYSTKHSCTARNELRQNHAVALSYFVVIQHCTRRVVLRLAIMPLFFFLSPSIRPTPPPRPAPLAAIRSPLSRLVACRYGMHVVVGNELHSRYERLELIFPGGEERALNKAKGAGVSAGGGNEQNAKKKKRPHTYETQKAFILNSSRGKYSVH